uniref:Protein arginine N-methyltransferase n=1 Tax=Octactis speculum TaxID=3111310 RepID=A0A7S2FZY8_9STRA
MTHYRRQITRCAKMERRVISGVDLNSVPDISKAIDEAHQEGFDFISIPLVHPRQRRGTLGLQEKRKAPMTRSDMLLNSSTWTSAVVGKLSRWMWPALEHRGEDGWAARRAAEATLKQEISWASHLSLPAVLFPPLPRPCVNTSRLINQTVQQLPYFQVWITVRLSDYSTSQFDSPCNEGSDPPSDCDGTIASFLEDTGMSTDETALSEEAQSPWQEWNILRMLTEHSQVLFVALELCEEKDLPGEEELCRWEGEPVKVLVFPTSIFHSNRKGFPVLSRRHQALYRRFLRFNVQVMISGRANHPNGRCVYLQYLKHVAEQLPPLTSDEKFEAPYLDYLQAPLQPLMDNLESQTYETFERDPVKYEQYRKATALALTQRVAAMTNNTTNPLKTGTASNHTIEYRVVVMVVGAGRGPLVRAALKAASEVDELLAEEGRGLDMVVYAVEKNPNAVVTLQNLVEMEGWDNVTVIASDMRACHPPEKADIMISELLGSFGDNELSPECLDGAQEYLADHGVSIPCSYTSYVGPVAASKLWNEVRNNKGIRSGGGDTLKAMETAYVVKMHNVKVLAEIKPCFTFTHPQKQPTDNHRFAAMKWTLDAPTTVHGFSGYFEAQLLGDIYISIVPNTENYSEGMFSWFPLYFPLRHPVMVGKNEVIELDMWRCGNASRVWYEWAAITGHHTSPVHNPNGRSYFIGL